MHTDRPLRSFRALLVLLALAGGACTGPSSGLNPPSAPPTDPPTPTGPIDVHGTVVDYAGEPLSGKIVSIAGRTTTTDSGGAFFFEGVEVPYDVLVASAGSTHVDVASALTTEAPVVGCSAGLATRTAYIEGTVLGLAVPAPIGATTSVGVRTA
ncbi:MAG: hypothetical protein H5U40_00305, partial [Polyangiaceae bacterium]|nr:hypothetical protein [Polyangiaceae bacterium]